MRLGAKPGDVAAVEAHRALRSPGSTPVMTLTSVVLPAPFGPIRPTISPLVDRQRETVDGAQAAERARDVVDLEQRAHASLRRRQPIAAIPPGRNSTSSTIRRPSTAACTVKKLRQTDLFEQQKHRRADHRAEQRAQPADQHHHQRLDRQQDVEDVGGLDVVHPARIDGAGDPDEHGGKHEGGGLVHARVDAEHHRGILVLLDAAQREAERALAHQDGDGGGDRRQAKHDAQRTIAPDLWTAPFRDRQVEPHPAAGEVGAGIDQLAQNLGEHEACDGEIVTLQVQDGEPDQCGEGGGGQRRRPSQASGIGMPLLSRMPDA